METIEIGIQVFNCSKCGLLKPVQTSGGTGYGVDRKTDAKTCYACIGEEDQKELENAVIGDKFTHYLTNSNNEGYQVTNWPGSWKTGKLHCRKGRHNIAGCRYDVWFKVGKNYFHGVTFGNMTQICHIKCVKNPKRRKN